MTFALIVAMMGPMPPFAGKQIRFEVPGYSTKAECEKDKETFLASKPAGVVVIGASCQRAL